MKLEESVSTQEIAVDEELPGDLQKIIGTEVAKCAGSLPATSFQHLFWQTTV